MSAIDENKYQLPPLPSTPSSTLPPLPDRSFDSPPIKQASMSSNINTQEATNTLSTAPVTEPKPTSYVTYQDHTLVDSKNQAVSRAMHEMPFLQQPPSLEDLVKETAKKLDRPIIDLHIANFIVDGFVKQLNRDQPQIEAMKKKAAREAGDDGEIHGVISGGSMTIPLKPLDWINPKWCRHTKEEIEALKTNVKAEMAKPDNTPERKAAYTHILEGIERALDERKEGFRFRRGQELPFG